MSYSRIISLVPSITLLLADLGLAKNIVGRTRFCIHPEAIVKHIPTVGGTKNADLQKIIALDPDLIIANKEENERSQIEILQRRFRVLVTDVQDMEDNYRMIAGIGQLTGTVDKAVSIISASRQHFSDLSAYVTASSFPVLNALYLIWRKPWMSVGGDTFIHNNMKMLGLRNILEDTTRYPVIEDLAAHSAKCDLVLLSSEPYPFSSKHIPEIRKHLPKSRILLVDGECFSWYGSRMLDAAAYFRDLLPEIHEQKSA